MSVQRLNLRFHLEREGERRAWEYLQGVENSKNRAIIQAVNAYAEAQAKQIREDAFLNRIVETIRAELKSVPQPMVTQTSPQTQSNPVDEAAEQVEIEDTVLNFLDFFG